MSGPVLILDATPEGESIAAEARGAGYLVLRARPEDGEALAALRRPALVVLDADAPSALALCGLLRTGPGVAELPIVLVGHPGMTLSSAADAIVRGGNAFVSRPVDRQKLLDTLRTFLGASAEPVAREERLNTDAVGPAVTSVAPREKTFVLSDSSAASAPRSTSEEPECKDSSSAVGPSSSADRVVGSPSDLPLSTELRQVLSDVEQRLFPESPPLTFQKLPSEEDLESFFPAELVDEIGQGLGETEDPSIDTFAGAFETESFPLDHATASREASLGTPFEPAPRAQASVPAAALPQDVQIIDPDAGSPEPATQSPLAGAQAIGELATGLLPTLGHAADGAERPTPSPPPKPDPEGPARASASPNGLARASASPSGPARASASPSGPTRASTSPSGPTGASASPKGPTRASAPPKSDPERPSRSSSRAPEHDPEGPTSPSPPHGAARPSDIAHDSRGLRLRGASISTGELEDVDLPQLLGAAWAGRFTGQLRFARADAEKVVHLSDGQVLTVISNVVEDRLVDVLWREGRIARAQYEQVRAMIADSGRRAGAILVERGVLRHEELFPLVRHHFEGLLYDLFAWDRGQWSVQSGVSASAERIVIDVATPSLILEGLRRKMTPEILARKLGGGGTVLGRRAVGLCPLESVALLPEELEIFEKCDGRLTLREILPRGAEADLGAALYGLVVLGHLEVVSPDARVSAALPRTDIDRVRVLERLRMAQASDYFSILGVARSATGYEIRRAYLELRRELTGSASEPSLVDIVEVVAELRVMIEEAYEVLRDPALRTAYDAHLP